MKKLNRRDYLTKFGTGVLAVGSASNLLGKTKPKLDPNMQTSAKKKRGTSGTTNARVAPVNKPFERWPLTDVRPESPSVFVYFWGLISFAYKGGGVAEAGIYSKDPAHKFELNVFEDCTPKPTPSGNPQEGPFTLGIERRSPDTRFFRVPGDFNRKSSAPHLRDDFRWLPDFESDEFYNQVIPIKSGYYTSRLLVNHGTFLTHLRTESKFDIAGGRKPNADVHWARIVVLQIALSDQERVKLEIPGEQPIYFSKGKQTEIYFRNQCYDGTSLCSHSDFHLNFEATTLSPRDRCRLNLKQRRPGLPTGTCLESYTRKLGDTGLLNTDDAPCMGGGYGLGGFPPG
jgi:hypothetical protein